MQRVPTGRLRKAYSEPSLTWRKLENRPANWMPKVVTRKLLSGCLFSTIAPLARVVVGTVDPVKHCPQHCDHHATVFHSVSYHAGICMQVMRTNFGSMGPCNIGLGDLVIQTPPMDIIPFQIWSISVTVYSCTHAVKNLSRTPSQNHEEQRNCTRWHALDRKH